MKERLLADLDARIARHADGDPSGVLDEQALALVAQLTELGGPDAGSLARVAALHLCRYQSLPPEQAETDLRLARALYTNLHSVDPRLVPAEAREFFGLASPHDTGTALMAEYERTGHLDHLERAISLFRQVILEDEADQAAGRYSLGLALFHRFERTGQPADLDEAIELGRGAVDAAGGDHQRRVGFQLGLADGLLRRFELTGDLSDVDEAVAVRRDVVATAAFGPDHASALLKLAGALARRFERTGRRIDLDEANELLRTADAERQGQ
jgi:tetratricopeptide (TPR) repeat protein